MIVALASDDQPWMDRNRPPEERAELLVAAMTFDEKLSQLHGQIGLNPEFPCGHSTRHVPGVPRLRIPTMRITNGPAGVGPGDCVPQKPATALPSGLALAASWDPALAYAFGEIAGTETVNLATHVFEAPGLNIARVPQNGRNFEYFGEDPYLAGRMAVEQVKAVQSRGVIAMPKHYAANNQETNRFEVDELIDERTLREIYLPAFEMAVKDGGAAAVMCAYPRINGTYACENELPPEGGAPKGVGLQGIRAVGLRRRSQHGAVHPGGHGPGDEYRHLVQRRENQRRARRGCDPGRRHRHPAQAQVPLDVPARPVRSAARGDGHRRDRARPARPLHRGAERSSSQEREWRAAARLFRLAIDRTDRAASAGARRDTRAARGAPRSSRSTPSPLSRACGTS